jgi:hypothetical protein
VLGAIFQHAATALVVDLLDRTGGGGCETAAGSAVNILDLTKQEF